MTSFELQNLLLDLHTTFPEKKPSLSLVHWACQEAKNGKGGQQMLTNLYSL